MVERRKGNPHSGPKSSATYPQHAEQAPKKHGQKQRQAPKTAKPKRGSGLSQDKRVRSKEVAREEHKGQKAPRRRAKRSGA